MIPVGEPLMHPGWYIGLSAALALVPLVLGTTTSYLKISLALGVLRNGFGAQQVPSNTIIMVLSLVLSLFIMQPVADRVMERLNAFPQKNLATTSFSELIEPCLAVLQPWREFLEKHSGARELAVLAAIRSPREVESSGRMETPTTAELRLLLPAFVLTELKEGLMIGFILLLPFLVIDLVVANILAGLGMYMMSPTIISLPLKLLLFVSIDGWLLISRGFVASYGVLS